MTSLDEYIDAAKTAQNISADRQLAIRLGGDRTAVSAYRTGRSLPSDAQMLKLAQMAHLDPTEALIDLNFMRCARDGDVESATIYQSLKEKVSRAALVLMVIFGFNFMELRTVEAATFATPELTKLYIIRQIRRWRVAACRAIWWRWRGWFNRRFTTMAIV